jgi:O-antigen/teichoic acid export membrane protein
LLTKIIYKNKVTKETFWALCAKFFSVIGGIFVLIFVPKAVGVETFGSFSLILAYISIFGKLYGGAVHNAIKKEVTEYKWNATSKLYFIESIKIKLGATFISTPLVFILIYLCNIHVLQNNFFYFFLLVVTMNFWGSIVSTFEDTHRLVYEAIIYFIEYSIKIVLILIFFIFFDLNLKTLLLSFFLGYFFALLAGLFFVISHYKTITLSEIFSYDIVVIKNILQRTFFLTLTTLSLVLFAKIDVVMISFFLSLDSVGFYSIGSDITKHAIIFSMPFILGVVPLFVKDERPHKLFIRSLRNIFIINMLIFILIIVCSRYIVLLIYGEYFLQVVPVLMILAIYPFLAVMQVLIQKVLILFDKTKQIFFFGLCAVVLNIILNAWFIPLYNIVGAAIATIASYISWNIISYMYVDRLLRRRAQCVITNATKSHWTVR